MAAQEIRRPPGPKGRPLVGLFPEFRRNPAAFLTRIQRDYGDIAYWKLGPQHIYLLNRPEWVQDVLVTNSGKFRKSRLMQRAKVLLGEGLLTAEGQFHLRQRRLMQPAFHRDRLKGYASVMVECAELAQSRWRNGETLDMAEEMTSLTLAIVGRTLFSVDVESEAREVGEALTAVLGTFGTLMLPGGDILRKLPIPSVRRAARAREMLDRTIYRIITERRKSGRDHGDLLSMLLLAQDEDDGGTMTDKQVRDEALTLFLAGHETTANALTWTWYLLSQNPEVELKLLAELYDVLGARAPSFDDLPNLRYTEMVLAEALRLYPPAWSMARLAAEEYEVAGYRVPAGSIIAMSPYLMHRKPEYYPDPERFEPYRWRPGQRDKRPKFAYFPFGGGPRVCIGERFAWMEGTLLIATIARCWHMRVTPGHIVEIRPQITLRTRHGMRMVLGARGQNV